MDQAAFEGQALLWYQWSSCRKSTLHRSTHLLCTYQATKA